MAGGVYHRIGGLICLAVAGAAGWWGIWRPWQQALAQEPQVRYHLEVFVLVPLAAVFGLFFLLLGDSVPYRSTEKQNFTAAGWLLMLAAIAASGLCFWWFKAQFAALGYGY